MILIYRREKSNPSPIIFKGTKELGTFRCFTLVPFTKKLGTFRSRLGTFRLMYHAEVVSFDQMYHAEVVSFRQMYHAEVVSFAL